MLFVSGLESVKLQWCMEHSHAIQVTYYKAKARLCIGSRIPVSNYADSSLINCVLPPLCVYIFPGRAKCTLRGQEMTAHLVLTDCQHIHNIS